MEILEKIPNLKENTAVSLGFFDGLHIGHKKLIQTLVNDAKQKGLKSLVYTFKKHPNTIVDNKSKPITIYSLNDKKRFIKNLGVDILCLLNFDDLQKNIMPKDFIKNILIDSLNMKHLVVGYDFKFGKNALGNIDLLIEYSKKYSYTYDIIQPVKKDFVRVSSTLIRKLLRNGKIKDANYYLGRKYTIVGEVVDGEKMGRKLGYPTANLRLDKDFPIIKPGVYITKTYVDGNEYKSVTNVGFNPTFDQRSFSVETYILDFHQDIYGKLIKVEFHKKIRDEMKFNDVNNLKEYIKWDVYTTKKHFNLID